MEKIITYGFNSNFLAELAGYIRSNFTHTGNDLSRLAVIFGGRRPEYFLKRELAGLLGKSYMPPRFFTIDEFMREMLSTRVKLSRVSALDAAYIIYDCARKSSPDILKGREDFARFLPWAKQISAFIDELDLEDIDVNTLKNLQSKAGIGYDIPDSLNLILENVVSIRCLYHEELISRDLYSRGLLYRSAVSALKTADLSGFDRFIFGNFYYLHRTEEMVLKHFLDAGRSVLFFQRDSRGSDVFDRLSSVFGQEIKKGDGTALGEVKIYKGFDNHSQACLAREALKTEVLDKGRSLDNTLILLAEPDNLIPLLSEISGISGNYNVSMGYPLRRSSLFSLFQRVFQAQERRKGDEYYSRDYLKVILHPLIKNLKFGRLSAASRILAHKIEEAFLGMFDTGLSGSLFVKLDDIERTKDVFLKAADTMSNMDGVPDIVQLKDELSKIHDLCFRGWENVSSFREFIQALDPFLGLLVKDSFVGRDPLNVSILERIYGIKDEIENCGFKEDSIGSGEIFKIFISTLEEEKISFRGSPLKGLQILGLFETRSLTFDNVIVMDMNEGVLPKVSVYDPLIPRQIMESLGLKRLKQEEEIQRYHFMRLISSAKRLYFIYNDSPQKERSRFLEELFWSKQKEKGVFDVFPEVSGRFKITLSLKDCPRMDKDETMVDRLSSEFNYSPSSLDTYLRCPLQFYYQYVLRMREKEDRLGEPEARDIGNFIHNLLERSFAEFLGKRPVIDAGFRKRFFEEFERLFDSEIRKRMGSEAFMVKDVMEYRLGKFLDNEQERGVQELLCLEKEMRRQEIDFSGRRVKFTCRLDRLDLLDSGSVLIIDYKTGGLPDSPSGFEKLSSLEFSRESILKSIHSFQLPIYYHFMRREYPDKPLNAMLYGLRDCSCKYFVKEKEAEKADEVMKICREALGFILSEIMDPKVPFIADNTDENYCLNCPFSAMCG